MTLSELAAAAEGLGFKLVALSDKDRAVIALRQGPMTTGEMAEMLGIERAGTVSTLLSELKAADRLKRNGSVWSLADDGALTAPVLFRPRPDSDWESRLRETWADRKARRQRERAA